MYQGHLSPIGTFRRTFQPYQAFSSTRPLLTLRTHTVTVRVVRLLTVEKVIMSGVNMKELPSTTRNFFNIRVSILEKAFLSVANVGKPLYKCLTSFYLGEFTQEKNSPMSAVFVGNPLTVSFSSFDIRVFTLEKSPISAVFVGNASAANIFSFNIKAFTMKKSLMNAVSVRNALATNLIS